MLVGHRAGGLSSPAGYSQPKQAFRAASREAATTTSTSVLGSLRPVFRAIASAVVPATEEFDDGAWRALEALVEESLSTRPAKLHRQIRLLLRAMQWLPVLRFGRPFTSLDPPARAQFLAGIQNSRLDRLRVGFWGLRTLVMLGYYGRPATAAAIGYTPNPRGWEGSR